MTEPPPDLLTIDQTAHYLQCSRRRVIYLMKKKDFPVVRSGRLVRIVKARLLPWLQSPAANKPAKLRVKVPPREPQKIVKDLGPQDHSVDLMAVAASVDVP